MRNEYTWKDKRDCWEKNVKCANGKYTKLRAYGRGSLPELKRMIREHENQQEELAQIKSRITVAKIAEEWKVNATANLAYASKQAIENALKNHILPNIGTALGIDDEGILGLTVNHTNQVEIAAIDQFFVTGRGLPLLVVRDGRRIDLVEATACQKEQTGHERK